jgi:hypothetical protein
LGLADLRKIGKVDAVVANSGGGNGGNDSVGVLLGNGDGTFQAPAVYDSGATGGIATLVLADLNGDGKTDIILFNANAGTARTGAVTALFGNGDGTFQPAIVILNNTGTYGWQGIALADLNSDGKLDLIVGEYSPAYASVLLGNGDGTFQPPVNYAINGGTYLASMAVADVNGDGKLDILVGNLEGDGLSVLLGNGDGTFKAMHSYGSGSIDSITVSDVNGDGKKDLVVTCCSGAGQGEKGAVGVLLGNGDGSFQAQVDYGVGGGIIETMEVAVADMNGDGKMDVVAADLCYADSIGNCVKPGAVSVLLHAYSTTTALVSSLNPSVFGQSVTFTATVRSNFRTPGGTVVLYDGTNQVASGSLVNGRATIPVSILAVGSHSITAAYQGGPGYAPSTSGLVNQAVTLATSTTSLVSSLNPVPLREYVTYTAIVTSQHGGPVTGTVTFQDGGSTVATVGLNGSQATLTTNYTVTGTHSITATYSGDQNNAGGTSGPLVEQVITGLVSKTVLTTSRSPISVGQAVTFTATVTSRLGTIPDGELVTFYDGKTLIGSVALTSEKAAYTTSALSAGSHAIKAVYPGDANFQPSTGTVKQVVLKYATTTSLTSSPNPSSYGQTVTFTATVTKSGPYGLTGKVRFFDGTNGIGTVTLSGGVATFERSTLGVGTHPITAKYLGDAYNDTSASPVVEQVVQ